MKKTAFGFEVIEDSATAVTIKVELGIGTYAVTATRDELTARDWKYEIRTYGSPRLDKTAGAWLTAHEALAAGIAELER